jgi:hypothetical protein
MKVTDLIMELAKMPPELEVIYQKDETPEGFKMEIVEILDIIEVDNGSKYVMINPSQGEINE